MELHPSKSAGRSQRVVGVVSKGINADVGPYRETNQVYCKQCGFPCNLDRDLKGIKEFSGESTGKYTLTLVGTDYVYVFSAAGTSEISNGSFEDWTAGVPDSWTVAGTTVTEDNTYYDKDGYSSSAKVVRSGSDVSLSQDGATPSNFNGNILSFKVRVKCTTKDVIMIRITLNGTNYDSSYNSGQTNYETLVLTVHCPSTVTTLTAYILANSKDGTAYIDSCVLSSNSNTATTASLSGCPHCGSFNYA